jgi:hypothetical protein
MIDRSDRLFSFY